MEGRTIINSATGVSRQWRNCVTSLRQIFGLASDLACVEQYFVLQILPWKFTELLGKL